MKKYSIEKYIAVGVVVLGAVLLRLVPHLPNVAPIGALALFSGAILSGPVGFAIPLVAMGISDIFLGFHSTIPYVYGSFLLIGGIGYMIRKKTSPLTIALASLCGSLLFFVVTNFGSWLTSPLYQKNMSGLLQSYVMGLPFFRNTLLGDLFYNAVFFVGYRTLLHLSKQIVFNARRWFGYYLS